MKRVALLLVAVAAMACAIVSSAPASGKADEVAAPTTIPAGYRDWKLVTVAHEEGSTNDLRAILGNEVAIRAYREGRLSFPDGAILARIAWAYDPLKESAEAFGHAQSFVAGAPKNGIQFMVKDSKKYAATGGWGFVQFNDGKPGGEAAQTCFACHQIVKERDFVFNRYAR